MSKVTDRKDIWLVYSNTDLTEGKGRVFVEYVCESEATARRKAKQNYIQGTDSPVSKGEAYRIYGVWYYPSVKVETTTRS
jgi:hypothetical protein